MKRIVLAFVLMLSLFTVTSLAADMTGYISDSKCGAKGEKDAHADCAVKCVKGGAAPVFVSDGKVYKRIYARDLSRFDSAEGGAHLGALKILE